MTVKFISEIKARKEIIRVMRIVTAQGLVRSSDGNISIRIGENRFLFTPSGLYKAAMTEDDLIVVNWKNEVVKGRAGLGPTSETLMHLEVYRQRDDIAAVLHAHPLYATALTIAGLEFPLNIIPEVPIALGEVPVAEYATTGTSAMADSIREPIQKSKSLLLSHHGSLTAGKTLEEALIALERMEHAAHSYFIAKSMGQIIPIPEEEMIRLQEIGRHVRKEKL